MMDWRRWFVQRKYEFDIGVSFLTILNLALISLTASKVINEYVSNLFGVTVSAPLIVGTLVTFALLGTWGFGYILDKKIRFMEEMNTQSNRRNIQFTQILDEIKKMAGEFHHK